MDLSKITVLVLIFICDFENSICGTIPSCLDGKKHLRVSERLMTERERVESGTSPSILMSNQDSSRKLDQESRERCVLDEQDVHRSWNFDDFTTTVKMIEIEGYPVEVHSVFTDDGYRLTMHRIPGYPGSFPILLQHGLMASSFDWVIGGKKRFALAFLLADQGYDVWMGNARGNIYSRCHKYYNPSQSEFWDFSWQEMGLYDLPAEIDFITGKTNQNVTYVGHSMGTTMFFVMAIERPEIASKIKVMFGLSPIVFMSHSKSPLRLLAPYIELLKIFMDLIGAEYHLQHKELTYTAAFVKLLTDVGCTLLDQQICFDLIFYLVGYNPTQFDRNLLPDILSHNILAGISTKTLAHYAQEAVTGKFSYYDYGRFLNRRLYGSFDPPNFDISKIEVPIGIIWSQNDLLADPKDVQKFYEKLPRGIFNYKVADENFSHIDFILARNAYDEVYKILIEAIKKANK